MHILISRSSIPSTIIKRHQATLAALAVVATSLGWSAPGQACSLDPCPAPVRLFGRDAVVPGNLVYFQLLGGQHVEGELQSLVPLTLETAQGEPIPASVRSIGHDRVFAPDQPIPAETRVVLRYQLACRFAPEVEGDVRVYEFTTSEAVTDFVLGKPSLTVTDEGVNANDRAFVKLRYDLGATSAALSHLIDWDPAIDDVAGSLRAAAFSTEVSTFCEEKEELSLDSCDGIDFVPEGKYTIRAKATIVGFDDLQEISTDVETRCAPATPDDDVDADLPGAVTDSESAGGCSLSGSSSGGASSLLALLGLCVARLRTRGRRAR